MSGIGLTLAETDPAAFVLAVADLREQRAKALPGWELEDGDDGHEFRLLPEEHSGSYEVQFTSIEYGHGLAPGIEETDDQFDQAVTIAEHVFSEANPDHALAEVALWRGVVERHAPHKDEQLWCRWCSDPGLHSTRLYPCPDLLAVIAAAKAYLGGAQ